MSRSNRNSMKKKLKRLLSFNESNSCDISTSWMTKSQDDAIEPISNSVYQPRMTQSYTGEEVNKYGDHSDHVKYGDGETNGKVPSVEELLVTTEELLKYTRGSGRRSCIISKLDLGPEDRMDLKENRYNKSLLKDRSQSYNDKLNQSMSLSLEGESLIDSSESKPNGIVSATEVLPERDYQNPVPNSDKTRSLTRSFKRLLPSKKKARSPDSLEYFLKYKLKTSEFHDEKLLGLWHSHWRELIVCKDGETLVDIFKEREIKRLDVVWELFQNECIFLVEQLMVLKHVFLEPLKNCQVEDYLMAVEPYKLFGNLDELCHISYAFCRDFMSTLNNLSPGGFGNIESLVDCLENMTLNSQYGQVYHSYLLNYKKALTYLASLRNEIEEISVFEKFCEQDSRCNRLKLADLLVAPMHHWTRLPLVLSRIRDYTDDQEEIDKLEDCIDSVRMSLESLENKMEWMKTFERVKEIDRQLIWPSIVEPSTSKPFIPDRLKNSLVTSQMTNQEVLADQVREVLYEGQLLLTEDDSSLNIYAFLFTDILLISKAKKESKKSRNHRAGIPGRRGEYMYTVIGEPLPVESLTIYDITDADNDLVNMSNAFTVVQRNKFRQISNIFTFQARTSVGKENWMSWIKKASSQLVISRGGSEPRRQESFKQMLNLDEASPNNLIKMSRVLELNNSPSRFRNGSKSSGQLRKLNSSIELSTFRRKEGNKSELDNSYERSLEPQSRIRAMSVGSGGTRSANVTNCSQENKSYSKESLSQLTIEESTGSEHDSSSESPHDDVVFEL